MVGFDPATEPFEVRRKVGMLFQNPENGLVAPFVEDDVAFGLENLGVGREEMRGRVREAIRAVGLEGYERREPHTLSGGEKQRVALAGLLALDPEVLLLDEPTSMLDARGRGEVLERLDGLRGSRTVVHVTHHLDELHDADRVLVLNAGRLAADVSPGRLLADGDLLAANRLTLPTAPRLAMGLGLDPAGARTPEDLAAAILRRARPGVGVEVRIELEDVRHVYARGTPFEVGGPEGRLARGRAGRGARHRGRDGLGEEHARPAPEFAPRPHERARAR